MKCKISTVDKKSSIFEKLEKYLHNGGHHYKFAISDIFELDREGEKGKYNPQNLDNKTLLWHGSRFTNFTGILGNGLRIAPPEAPSTGYNFGKGVYLADMAGKSAPYCCPYLSNNEILLIACEASLGNPRELDRPDYNAANLPAGCHSTKCNGQTIPDPKLSEVVEKDIEIPNGPTIKNTTTGYMGHNEFIVYNTNQVKMRYLIRCKII